MWEAFENWKFSKLVAAEPDSEVNKIKDREGDK